jgi:hypothetical protein
MALNVFGPLTKEDIKVSYIDASLGLVSDVSIAQANQYVLTNPATTFIFQDGNKKFRYLNIDEVNKLLQKIIVIMEQVQHSFQF